MDDYIQPVLKSNSIVLKKGGIHHIWKKATLGREQKLPQKKREKKKRNDVVFRVDWERWGQGIWWAHNSTLLRSTMASWRETRDSDWLHALVWGPRRRGSKNDGW